jgi:hypothetical protein
VSGDGTPKEDFKGDFSKVGAVHRRGWRPEGWNSLAIRAYGCVNRAVDSIRDLSPQKTQGFLRQQPLNRPEGCTNFAKVSFKEVE